MIRQECGRLPVRGLPFHQVRSGMILAETVVSGEDFPPFDKAVMDGYAIRSSDDSSAPGSLEIIEEITAGQIPRKTVHSGQASRIMTGAPMPPGADAVVPVEMSQIQDRRVSFHGKTPVPGWNVIKKGEEVSQGATVLQPGTLLRPLEIALLAMLGRETIQVIGPPRVSILPTGDELVDVGSPLNPGQIRNSNGPMLEALVRRTGAEAMLLGIAADKIDLLTAGIREGLKASVLILSGGVSAGKLDLVPGVLQSLGVKPHFHKVAMKPGKPVFFGTRDSSNPGEDRKYVFGLPGNPVSALVCFELFVRPALEQLAGFPNPVPSQIRAQLTQEHFSRSDRPTYHPSHLKFDTSGWTVELVPWKGSSDLHGLLKANALALIPPGNHLIPRGELLTTQFMDRDISAFLS